MKNYKLPIKKNILLILSFISLSLILLSTFLKIYNKNFAENYSSLMYGIALMIQIIPSFIVLIDIIKNKIHNKLMWYLGLITFSSLATILYLNNREKHFRLYNKFKTM